FGPKEELTLPVAFSPDGKTLAVGARAGEAGSCKLVEADTGKEKLTLEGRAISVAFSPDGKLLATGGTAQALHFWEVARGKERRNVRLASGVRSLAFSPGGKLLAAAGDFTETIGLWSVNDILNNTREKTLAELKKFADVEQQDDGTWVSFHE